jgi:hypothetical protein
LRTPSSWLFYLSISSVLRQVFSGHQLSFPNRELQLDDLLRQNPSLAPAVPPVTKQTSKKSRSPWEKLVIVIQNMLRGRATKNISLLMVWSHTTASFCSLNFLSCWRSPGHCTIQRILSRAFPPKSPHPPRSPVVISLPTSRTTLSLPGISGKL